jgi:hypothetical protein
MHPAAATRALVSRAAFGTPDGLAAADDVAELELLEPQAARLRQSAPATQSLTNSVIACDVGSSTRS